MEICDSKYYPAFDRMDRWSDGYDNKQWEWIFQTGSFTSEAAGLFIKITCSLIVAAERMQSEKTIAAHQGIPRRITSLWALFLLGIK